MLIDHPDQTRDWAAYKAERRGAHQAIEDKALQAYHDALEQGRGKEVAEKQYFEALSKKGYG